MRQHKEPTAEEEQGVRGQRTKPTRHLWKRRCCRVFGGTYGRQTYATQKSWDGQRFRRYFI